MKTTENVYETLNQREKYILKYLNISEDDFKPENLTVKSRNHIMGIMETMTERISQKRITQEQFWSLFENYQKSHNIFFEGIDVIRTEADYPDIKYNVYKTLTKENRKILKMLGVKLKNKEITSKEYAQIMQILCDNCLIRFGTGIKKKECYKLMDKIYRILFFEIDFGMEEMYN